MGLLSPFSLIFHGFLVVSLFLKEAESCKTGWTFYKGHCYGLFNKKLAWADAEVECHSMGAHLASVHYMEEMVHLSNYIKRNINEDNGKGNVWIGLRISKNTKNWEWVDHTSVRYVPWDDGEPNNLWFKEECVEVLRSADYIRWNDRRCSNHQSYLCKLIAI